MAQCVVVKSSELIRGRLAPRLYLALNESSAEIAALIASVTAKYGPSAAHAELVRMVNEVLPHYHKVWEDFNSGQMSAQNVQNHSIKELALYLVRAGVVCDREIADKQVELETLRSKLKAVTGELNATK